MVELTALAGVLTALAKQAAVPLVSAAKAKWVFESAHRRWRDAMLETPEAQIRDEAFRDFFQAEAVQKEIVKAMRGDYESVDFKELEVQMRSSCRIHSCPVPDTNLYALLADMFEALLAAVKDTQAQAPLRQTLEALRRAEPGHRNHSLARRAYLDKLVEDHRRMMLRGFERPENISHIDIDDIFVMPRVVEGREEQTDEQGRPARELLRAGARQVIVGKPGAGKSTLLIRFAIGMARGEAGYPRLLPIFYRARDYHQDRQAHPGKSLFECLHERLATESLRLPHGFFTKALREQDSDGSGIALLVDGLDEVMEDSHRLQLMQSVDGLVRALRGRNSLAVITSRPHEYEKTPFDPEKYPRHSLCEFNDAEIQQFIAGWRRIRETSESAARKANRELWDSIRQQPGLREMAANPLLLTMITCVHLWKGELPESRVELYRVCSQSLVDNWSTAVGLGLPEISQTQKLEFLAELAYGMQSEASAEQMENALEISRDELHRKLEAFLERKRKDTALADRLLERFHAREAILLHQGGGRFRFIHRSFQEYFAARWLYDTKGPVEMREKLDVAGWRETVALAAAQLPRRDRNPFLLDLLAESRAEDALACLPGAGAEVEDWLVALVRFLAKRTREGREHGPMPASDCLAPEGREETLRVLSGIFGNRWDGSVLAAAVELAEALADAGDREARALVEGFFAEGRGVEREMVPVAAGPFRYGEGKNQRTTYLPAFEIDRYPVTNRDYRKMVLGHRVPRGFDGDDQPVVMVSHWEAALYARWSGCVLPTEEQWEKAASWDEEKHEKRTYPWGEWDDRTSPQKCSTSESGLRTTTPVAKYPEGKSAYGCFDMAGNVWEWTGSFGDTGRDSLVLRGGSWDYDHQVARCAFRFHDLPVNRFNDLGFRCART